MKQHRTGGPEGLIPERIRNRRERMGMTATELAKRAGVSPSYLSLIESGAKVPSEEIAIRLARALGDDPDIYRAWVHAARHPDLDAHLGRMQRLAQVRSTPKLSRQVRTGGPVEKHEPDDALERAAPPPESASGRRRRWFRFMERPSEAEAELSCSFDAMADEDPGTVAVPVLPEGSLPGNARRTRELALETIHLDRRLLPPHAGELFAYRPGAETAGRVGPLLRAGDLVVLSRRIRGIDPDSIYAVRRGRRVVLSRVVRHGNLLLLLSDDSSKPTESIEVEHPEDAVALLAGVVLTTIRTWSPPPEHGSPAAIRPEPRGRSVRLEGNFLVRDCEWRERYGWRPHQRAEDLDYLESRPGTKIRFRLIRNGRVPYHLEMDPDQWRAALGEFVETSGWRTNGYIVAITRRESGEYTLDFQDRWAPYVRPVDADPG